LEFSHPYATTRTGRIVAFAGGVKAWIV
jgi:hypothetical protein